MKMLIDTGKKIIGLVQDHGDYVLGQLLSPATSYLFLGYPYGIDNSAFSNFDSARFKAVLKRQTDTRDQCLFVACPDIVGSARRTLEVFDQWYPQLVNWPVALVAQDGMEDMTIPWQLLSAIFIGGTTDWKMSECASDIIRTAKMIGKHVHIGRINTPARFKHFADLCADTCDGSGVARFDWMLAKIISGQLDDHPLFDK